MTSREYKVHIRVIQYFQNTIFPNSGVIEL